jgi:O-antigen ligase
MLTKIHHQDPGFWTSVAAVLLVGSMPFSPFLLSVGMWCLVAVALWSAWLQHPKGLLSVLRYSWGRFVENRVLLVLSLLFWVPVLSIAWSEDLASWLTRVRVRLPFLILPWAFANLPLLRLRQLAAPIYASLLVMVVLSAGVLVNFLLEPELILNGLKEGQPVPVPRHHIRFSLIMVATILSAGWLSLQRHYWSSARERLFFGIGILFLVVTLHVLTVRSALVAFYAGLLFTLLRFWWKTRNWKLGVLALIILSMVPVITYFTVESVRNRIAYMRYDWEQFRSDKGGANYSDAERFVSLDVGLRIWLENPLLGVGVGDLELENQRMTDRIHPEYSDTPKLPHNQWIYILASTGLLGFLLSGLAWIYPLFFFKYRKNYLFLSFQVLVFVSFLVEYTLETSIGAAFCLFFQLWWIKMAEAQKDYQL